MTPVELLVALALLAGLVGICVQVLPGSVVILLALLGWAAATGGPTAWTVFVVAAVSLVIGSVVKYLLPGRRLRARGIPTRTLLLGAVAAVVGFFVIPVVGLLVGFVAGVYAAERLRVGRRRAWPSTRYALRAVGASILIELAAAGVAIATWIVGLVLT